MNKRDNAPNAAFAYVGTINNVTFKLLRHHNDSVKDGNEHDTVNPGLLSLALNLVDHLPISTEEKNKTKQHLLSHANSSFILELNEKNAKKIINQQDAGDFKFANDTINDKDTSLEPDPVMVPETKADNVENAIVKNQKPASAAIVQDDGEKPVGNPSGNGKSDNPNSGGSFETPIKELDGGSLDIGSPNNDKLGKASDNTKTDSKSKKKVQWTGYSILLNKSDNKLTISPNPITQEGLELIATAYTDYELSDVENIVIAESLDVRSADAQNQQGVVIKDNDEKVVLNTDKDQMGKASLYIASNDITDFGRKFLFDMIAANITNPKVVKAKVLDSKKYGSVEYMSFKCGDIEYPMHIYMDIYRDSEGNISGVKLLNSDISAFMMADLSKILNDLSKEVKKSESSEVDLATAPAKLEKCKSDVLSKKVADFKKKHGKAPTEKQRKEMESSAWAICTAALKKSGQL